MSTGFARKLEKTRRKKGCNERKFRKVGVSGGNKEDVGLKMVSVMDATDLATKKCKNVFENRAEDTPRMRWSYKLNSTQNKKLNVIVSVQVKV